MRTSRYSPISPDLPFKSPDFHRNILISVLTHFQFLNFNFQAERSKVSKKLREEIDQVEDEVTVLTGTSKAPKQLPLTTPIDKYMAKKTAPVPYQKTGPIQRRIDLEVMTLVATANLPFSLVGSKPFQRCDE